MEHEAVCYSRYDQGPEYGLDMLERSLAALGHTCIVDHEGRYIYITKTYAEQLGLAPEQVIGRKISDVLDDSTVPIVLKTGQPIRESLYLRNNTINLINRLPIYAGGKVVGAVAQSLATDDKTVRQLQNRLSKVVTELNYYKEKVRLNEGKRVSADAIVTRNEGMIALKESLSTVARTRSSVLITGESGTGKEVVSCAIHDLSPRKDKPFIRLNCAAIPDNLLEAELFGYEEGAFTGALKGGKMGDFEAANKGTLLLDEVDSLTLNMQSKLLRAIQEREIKKVGSIKSIPIDVRFIFATNKDLASMVREGKFREDFYYRINVISLEIPPLRERLDDIPLLVDHFIQKFNEEMDMDIQGITPKALDLLQHYHWPGNIRELENHVERAFNYTAGPFLDVSDFGLAGEAAEAVKLPISLREARETAERDAILRALQQADGNKKEAAQILEIDRSLLYDKLRRYNLVQDVKDKADT